MRSESCAETWTRKCDLQPAAFLADSSTGFRISFPSRIEIYIPYINNLPSTDKSLARPGRKQATATKL